MHFEIVNYHFSMIVNLSRKRFIDTLVNGKQFLRPFFFFSEGHLLYKIFTNAVESQ